VAGAAVFSSDARCLVRIDFVATGSWTLARVTGANVGRRLVVFLDDELIMSPVIRGRLQQGSVYLDGSFSTSRAHEIVERLNARREDDQAGGEEFRQ